MSFIIMKKFCPTAPLWLLCCVTLATVGTQSLTRSIQSPLFSNPELWNFKTERTKDFLALTVLLKFKREEKHDFELVITHEPRRGMPR